MFFLNLRVFLFHKSNIFLFSHQSNSSQDIKYTYDSLLMVCLSGNEYIFLLRCHILDLRGILSIYQNLNQNTMDENIKHMFYHSMHFCLGISRYSFSYWQLDLIHNISICSGANRNIDLKDMEYIQYHWILG